jgi:integrase
MGRKRKSRKDLPERVYYNHNAYYFTTREGKWIRLGNTLSEALSAYADLVEPERIHTMGQVMDRYLAEVVINLNVKTQDNYRRAIKRLKPVFGHMKPEDIKPKDVYLYQDIRSKKNGVASANIEKSVLRVVFTKAIEWGVTEKNPCKEVKSLSMKTRDRYITDDEYRLLYKNASRVLQCIMDMAYVTGLRIGDILKTKLSDIQDGELTVITEKTGKKLVFAIVDDLEVVITRAKVLKRPILSHYLFCDRTGKKISKGNFNMQWIRLKKKLGLHETNLHFHDIRVKSATDADEEGINAQQLLGHSKRATTDRYVKQRKINRVMPLSRVKGK